jgi:hypothetical protein
VPVADLNIILGKQGNYLTEKALGEPKAEVHE